MLRSPVQRRPAIALAAVVSQGARGFELAVTFLDSTVGGIALCLPRLEESFATILR